MLNIDPTATLAWRKLKEHFEEIKDAEMKQLFSEEPQRFNDLSINWEDFLIDFSKNRITKETQQLLLDLAKECGLEEAISSYFGGETINRTENRPVLHTALRARNSDNVLVEGKNVIPEIFEVKAKMQAFSDAIISGSTKGYSGLAFTDVVNIGIGGSDLGPAMVTEALKFYKNHLNVHYIFLM